MMNDESQLIVHYSSLIIPVMPLDVKKTWDACGEAFHRFTSAEDSFSENIERPAVERLLGDMTGSRILDLGCGSGSYTTRLAERGAQVVGLDLSEKMISLAREAARGRGVDVELRIGDIREPLPFSDREFDAVFTATALHYVEELASTMAEIRRVLKPAGVLVASVLHPASTACFPLGGSPRPADVAHWELRYFGAPVRSIETPWAAFGDVGSEGRRLSCYHHTIEDYFNAIKSAGLVLTDMCEPAPAPALAEKNPARYEEATRVPVYLIFRASKPL